MASVLSADSENTTNRLGRALLSMTRSLKSANEGDKRKRSVGGKSERKTRVAWMKKISISLERPIRSLSSESLAR